MVKRTPDGNATTNANHTPLSLTLQPTPETDKSNTNPAGAMEEI